MRKNPQLFKVIAAITTVLALAFSVSASYMWLYQPKIPKYLKK